MAKRFDRADARCANSAESTPIWKGQEFSLFGFLQAFLQKDCNEKPDPTLGGTRPNYFKYKG